MGRFLSNMLSDVVQWSGSLNRTHWILIMIAVVAVGCVFLRGNGSRSAY